MRREETAYIEVQASKLESFEETMWIVRCQRASTSHALRTQVPRQRIEVYNTRHRSFPLPRDVWLRDITAPDGLQGFGRDTGGLPMCICSPQKRE